MEGLWSVAQCGKAGPAEGLGGLLHGSCGLVLVGSPQGVGSYSCRDGWRYNRSFEKQLEKPFGPGRSMGFISPAALTPLAACLVLPQPFAAPKGCSFLLASLAV